VTDLQRHLVTVGDRQVHYRRAGSGPPVVLLHASPLSSAWHAELALALAAAGFCAIALDTPGYGLSDPLPIAEPSIADYASALAETLAALGIRRCGVYGFHTGASIALELASGRPELVAAAVLEGVTLPTAAERSALLRDYAPWFPPVWEGTHLVSHWSRVRDMFVFWPWFDRSEQARLALPVPGPELIDAAVVDLLRAGEGYPRGYLAAFAQDNGPALARLAVPAAIVADRDDPLSAHLGRLPALPPGVHSELIGGEGRDTRIVALLRELGAATTAPAPAAPVVEPCPGRLVRDITPTPAGQLLTRLVAPAAPALDAAAPLPPPLVLLHASPGSARSLEPLLRELGRTRLAIAFDTIGNGESDRPPWSEPTAADYADTVAAGVAARGIEQIDLYGTHTGAMLAIEVAVRHPQLVRRLILEGVVLFGDEERDDILAHYLEPHVPQWDGAHLLRLWSVRRDAKLWWPWYRRTPDRHRPSPPPGVEAIQRDVVELLKSGPTYALAYRVALGYPTRDRLPLVEARTLVCATEHDILRGYSAEAAALAPAARAADVPGEPAARAAAYAAFLDDPAG